jgi:uncharacterized membrane protein YedE/YeeE
MSRNVVTRFHFFLGLFGLLMGFSLHRMGFGDYAELHQLFIFADLRLLYSFMGAVVVASIGFSIVARKQSVASKPFHKGSIVGGILFGIGWAITGACPSVVLVHLGEGKFIAIATLLGVVFGVWLFAKLKPRYFRWSMGSCGF